MPWARFDDEALDHLKLVDAGPEGELFWVRCIWYCNRHLTDGFVSAAMARRICNLGDVDVLLSRLVDLRLLEVVDGGYHIHDWPAYTNLPKKQTHAVRKAWEAIASRVRPMIFARDGFRCRRCGATERLEVDHIIPIVLCGDNDTNNLQTLCLPCNRRKGAN